MSEVETFIDQENGAFRGQLYSILGSYFTSSKRRKIQGVTKKVSRELPGSFPRSSEPPHSSLNLMNLISNRNKDYLISNRRKNIYFG